MNQRPKKYNPWADALVFSAGSVIAAKTVAAPFFFKADENLMYLVIKKKMSSPPEFWAQLMRFCYRGHVQNCLKLIPTWAIRFEVYNYYVHKNHVNNPKPKKILSPGPRIFWSGFYGAMLSSLVTHPFTTVAEPGYFFSKWRGVFPQLFAECLPNAMMFFTFDQLKQRFNPNRDPVQSALCGSAAFLSSSVFFPMFAFQKYLLKSESYLKTRWKVSKTMGFLHSLGKHEGVLALYRGYLPFVASRLPFFAVTFGLYEFASQKFLPSSNNNW